MVNIKPLMGPEHPEVRSVLEQERVREISPRSLSPEESSDYTENKPQELPKEKEKDKEKKSPLANLLRRLNIIS